MSMRRRLNRMAPILPTQAVKTYQIASPAATHWRQATCLEVDCAAHKNGWKTVVDLSTQLGQKQAYYITKQSGRSFCAERAGESLVSFTFEPGQPCFGADKHRVRIGRPELYVVRGGDWRGNPRKERRVHTKPEDWVDDFANHQSKLADRLARG